MRRPIMDCNQHDRLFLFFWQGLDESVYIHNESIIIFFRMKNLENERFRLKLSL